MTDAYPIVALCTDFGGDGPYVGQMRAVLHQHAPHACVIDLFCNLPAYNTAAAAYLLPAYAGDFPEGTVFLCVVDPGVGDARRRPVALNADGRWFVGPENGLFDIIVDRARHVRYWHITWAPDVFSATFHGRDLFAPVAAMLACGESPPGEPSTPVSAGPRRPPELAEAVYIDHFGNVITGVRAASVSTAQFLIVRGRRLSRARTFSDMPVNEAFWYENANGLVEIAVNRGRAVDVLGIGIGDPVEVEGDAVQ